MAATTRPATARPTAAPPAIAPPTAVVEALLGVHRVVVGGLGAALAAHGASLDQWRVLRSLTETGCTMGELTKALDIPPASLTRIVDSLASNALVYRRPDLSDRRLVVIHLSANGQQRLTRLDDAAGAYLGAVREQLGAEVFDRLGVVLDSARRAL